MIACHCLQCSGNLQMWVMYTDGQFLNSVAHLSSSLTFYLVGRISLVLYINIRMDVLKIICC